MITLEKIDRKIKFYAESIKGSLGLKHVKTALKIKHPDYDNIMEYSNVGNWDGYVRFYEKDTFPHGLLSLVTDFLDKKCVKYRLVGFDTMDTSGIEFSKPFLVDSRDYQINAMKAFLKTRWGIIKVPTRGGKTFISAELMRINILFCPSAKILFLTESSVIYNQNGSEIANFLSLDEIGGLRGEDFNPKQVTMAMIQTLHYKLKELDKKDKRYKEKLEMQKQVLKYLKTVDFVVIDEIHEFLSDSRLKLLRKIIKNADWVLGLSATPFKKNQIINSTKMLGLLGGVVYEIEEKKLIDKGVLAKNRVLLIMLEHTKRLRHDGMDYHELKNDLFQNSAERNSIIQQIVKICAFLQRKLLVMTSSVEHGQKIAETQNLPFIYGETKEEERNKQKDLFLQAVGGCLIASEIWKKGVTLPEVEVFLNTSGGKEDTLLIQKRGRVLGATKNKQKALAIDIIDVFSEHFSEHSLERVEAYENQVGADDIDIMVFDSDFTEKFTNYVNSWFNG